MAASAAGSSGQATTEPKCDIGKARQNFGLVKTAWQALGSVIGETSSAGTSPARRASAMISFTSIPRWKVRRLRLDQ